MHSQNKPEIRVTVEQKTVYNDRGTKYKNQGIRPGQKNRIEITKAWLSKVRYITLSIYFIMRDSLEFVIGTRCAVLVIG